MDPEESQCLFARPSVNTPATSFTLISNPIIVCKILSRINLVPSLQMTTSCSLSQAAISLITVEVTGTILLRRFWSLQPKLLLLQDLILKAGLLMSLGLCLCLCLGLGLINL